MTSSGSQDVNHRTTIDDEAHEKDLYDQALAAVQQAPDIRWERVAALRQRVQDGTYYVPDHVLAVKLLEFCA